MTAEGKNLPAVDQATLLLLQRRGFCASVIRSIEVVEPALLKLGRPAHVRVEQVVNRVRSWGFSSIQEVEWTRENVRFYLPAELTNCKSNHRENLSTT